METPDDDANVALLPPKRQKRTNFNKCVICQRDNSETLRSAKSTSIPGFVYAVTQRQDGVYHRLEPDLDTLSDKNIKWRHTCHSNVTSDHNLKSVERRKLVSSPTPSTSSNLSEAGSDASGPKSRSQSAPTDWCKCIICKRKSHKGDRHLVPASTLEVSETIKNSAEIKGDTDMLGLLASVNNDLVAAEAKYHKACYSSYNSKSNLKYSSCTEGKQENVYAAAFEPLASEISGKLRSGKAFDMVNLLKKYKAFLKSKDVAAESYTAQRLKLRLKNYFGNEIVFHTPYDRSKPELMYSSSISLQDVLNAAYEQNTSTDTPEDDYIEPADPLEAESASLVDKTAKQVKSDIGSCKGIPIRPPNVSDLTLAKCRSCIPDNLYWLIRGIIANPETDDMTTPECPNEADERRTIAICQDIVYCASHSRAKMPKHVSMGMLLRHLTRSKELITLLNRMGHCVSYDDVEVMDTSLARELLAKSEALDGILLPTNITTGNFVQAAADNNDINEETIDGKHTTHATTLVLYQAGRFGSSAPQTRLYADHSQRRKSLKSQNIRQVMLEFSAFGRKPSISTFAQNIHQDWFTCTDEVAAPSCHMDMAWSLMRLCPTKLFEVDFIPSPAGDQQIPSWSGFNAVVHQPSMQSSIGYCPMIQGPSTDYSTVYTVMKKVQAMMSSLGQRDSVITFDLAIYIKAREIQFRRPEEFADTVVRMGGFHIVLNYLSVLGKKYEGSGLEDILIESGVYGSATVASIIRGKSYNRSVRAHKLVMEALFRLLWRSFADWLSHQSATSFQQANLVKKINQCQASMRDGEGLQERLDSLMKEVSNLEAEFNTFKEEAKTRSKLFGFWSDYIDMVQMMLQFLRAERCGDWELHLSTVAAMTPYFFAFDRPNYSKWLPVYLADMRKLNKSHPLVHQQFLDGNHSISRTGNPFSKVSTDMALEQSINRDSKTSGGVIGITKEEDALERWFLTCHQRAAMTTALKDMYGMQEGERVGHHKEATEPRTKKDEEDIQSLIGVFTSELMTDPFNLEGTCVGDAAPLINIATGVVMPPDDAARLIKAYELGHAQMTSFVEERFVKNEKKFWDPIQNLKIKTFAKLAKRTKVKTSKEKVVTISADRDLFSRLIIAAKTRDVNLKEVLAYELSPVPFAIAHIDGTLRKTDKCVLRNELESNVSDEVLPKLPLPTDGMSTAYLVDAMAMIQMTKSGGVSTFGELAEVHFKALTSELGKNGCRRVDVVFDRYMDESIKGGERSKRGASDALEVRIKGPATPIPKQWHKFIANPQNKTNLNAFLTTSWRRMGEERLNEGEELVIGGGFSICSQAVSVRKGVSVRIEELQSDQEEADTRLVLHAKHASTDNQRVVVQSPDTDVTVICISLFRELGCQELWFKTGCGDKKRYIPVHQIAQSLGVDVCTALPAFHALTGCDSTSSMSAIGKKTPWKILLGNALHQQRLAQVGVEVPVQDETIANCEQFICNLYTSAEKAGGKADDVRYWLFCQTQKKNEGLPPTSDSLLHHIKRANYQAYVWRKSLMSQQNLPSPNDHGWILNKDGEIEPVLMTKDPAPKALIELSFCRCKTSNCSRADCTCKVNNLGCTEGCLCFNSDQCQNPHSIHLSESDEED